MTLDMQRLEKLGLKQLLGRHYYDEEEFQAVIGKKLRELTFEYLKGELQDIIPDGLEVKELRRNLKAIGTFESFIKEQSPNGAWATELELTILSELVGANFAVRITPDQKIPTILTANPSETKPTILLINEKDVHWSATDNNGKKKNTEGRGNCGYHAVGLKLLDFIPFNVSFKFPKTAEMTAKSNQKWKDIAQPFMPSKKISPAEQELTAIIQKEEQMRLNSAIETAKKAEEDFNNAMATMKKESPEKYKAVQKQMHEDHLLALKLFVEDLPDANGRTKTSHSIGQLLMGGRNYDKTSLEKVQATLLEESGYSRPLMP